MNRALATGATDLIGIARPLCVEPALPRRLLKDPTARARPYRLTVGFFDSLLVPALSTLWHVRQIRLLAEGKPPRPEGFGMATLFVMLVRRAMWEPLRSPLFRHLSARRLLLLFFLLGLLWARFRR